MAIEEVIWRAPVEGRFSVSTDAAVKREGSTFGMVIHDHLGKVPFMAARLSDCILSGTAEL